MDIYPYCHRQSMDLCSKLFTLEDHPIIETLRLKGIKPTGKYPLQKNISETGNQCKYSDETLKQVYEKLEFSKSILNAINGIQYHEHFDPIRLNKLITIQHHFPARISNLIPYYIMHSALSYCVLIERDYNDMYLILVLKSLIFLNSRIQTPLARNMFYFILHFAPSNALKIDTKAVLEQVQILINRTRNAEPSLLSALVYWVSNVKPQKISTSFSSQALSSEKSLFDPETETLLSFIDELIKMYPKCIRPEDATILYTKIEKSVKSFDPFGMSLFSTLLSYIPPELLNIFYSSIGKCAIDYVKLSAPKYNRIDESMLEDYVKSSLPKTPQIFHIFRKGLEFEVMDFFIFQAKTIETDEKLMLFANKIVDENGRASLSENIPEVMESMIPSRRALDIACAYIQIIDQTHYNRLINVLKNTEVFDPRITIFNSNDELDNILKIRTYAIGRALETREFNLLEFVNSFADMPMILAEIFLRIGKAIETKKIVPDHFVTFPQIANYFIPAYQEAHINATDENRKAIERCRIAMFQFLIIAMNNDECFETFCQNEFFSTYFSLVFEKQIRDFLLDSLFAHFGSQNHDFISRIGDLLDVVSSPASVTQDYIELLEVVLRKLSAVSVESAALASFKRNILGILGREKDIPLSFFDRAIEFLIVMSDTLPITTEEVQPILTAIHNICGDEPPHSVFLALVCLCAGKPLEALSPDFLIRQPPTLYLIISAFKNSSRLIGFIQFIEQLCIFSTTNARQCQRGRLDIAIIDLIESKKLEVDENKILLQNCFSLFVRIACIASSRTTVQRFISLMCPIKGKIVSPVIDMTVKALTAIIESSHDIPISFFPITNKEPYISISKVDMSELNRGFTAAFWVFVDMGAQRFDTCLFSIENQLSVNLFKTHIILNYLGAIFETKTNIPLDEWTLVAITLDNTKGKTSIRTFINKFEEVFTISSVEFDNTNSLTIGYNPKMYRSEHPVLVGPFAFTQILSNDVLAILDTSGVNCTFANAFIDVKPEIESTMVILRSSAGNDTEIVGPSVTQSPTFPDIFLRSYKINAIIPLFAQANLSSDHIITLKPILNLVKLVFSISEASQREFDQLKGIQIVSFLLKGFDMEIYQCFYEIFELVTNQSLKKDLFDLVLTNARIISQVDEQTCVKITDHWTTVLFPSFKKSSRKGSDFSFALKRFVYYMYQRETTTNIRKTRSNFLSTLLIRAEKHFTADDFVLLLSLCINSKNPECAADLLFLIQKIALSPVAPFRNEGIDRIDIRILFGLHSLLNLHSVDVGLELLKAIDALHTSRTITMNLLVHIEVLLTKIPDAIITEDFVRGIINYSVEKPEFLVVAFYCVAKDTSKSSVLMEGVLQPSERYCVNKAWFLWGFIAGVLCGGEPMRFIYEFILYSSPKLLMINYILMDISSRLLSGRMFSIEPHRAFLRGAYKLISEKYPQNAGLFAHLVIFHVFYRRDQTHNDAILSAYRHSVFAEGVEKVSPRKERTDISVKSFIAKLSELEKHREYHPGMNLDDAASWKDRTILDFIKDNTSKEFDTILKELDRRTPEFDFSTNFEKAFLMYDPIRIQMSIEFTRLSSFIKKFFDKVIRKMTKINEIPILEAFDISTDIEKSIKACEVEWKVFWRQQTFAGAPWEKALSKVVDHFKRDSYLCYAYCPMRMKENRHFNVHKDASLNRDFGSAKTAQEKIEEYQKMLQEKYERESPDKLLRIDSVRDSATTDSEISEIAGLDQKKRSWPGVLIKIDREHPCELCLSKTGLILKTTDPVKIRDIDARDVKRILYRSYLHHPTGVEIFLRSGRSFFISLKENAFQVLRKISSHAAFARINVQTRKSIFIVPRDGMTERWVRGELSTFKYLMYLNMMAGRTFNDASLYPFMPWVLSNFDDVPVNLSDPANYRDLTKPVGVLGAARFNEIVGRRKDIEGFGIDFYMYSSCYVSPLCVYLWLMRMEPFTTLHTMMQSNKFDHAARLFSSVADSWRMVTTHSNDFRELIPEFFFDPHFLRNENKFDLGKIDERSVDNVALPKWASSPLMFVYTMRKALESDVVSQSIHKWIDLFFGVNASGKGAEDSFNTFDPNMYESAWTPETLNDPVRRSLIEATMKHCGQIPAPIFSEPHPARDLSRHRAAERTDGETGISATAATSIGQRLFFMVDDTVVSTGGQHPSETRRLCYTSDHRIIRGVAPNAVCVSSQFGYVEVVDFDRRQPLKLLAHTGRVTAIATSRSYIVTGGLDSAVCIFAVRPHLVQVAQIPLFRDEVVDVAISEKFKAIAAVTRDGGLLVIDIARSRVMFSTNLEGAPHHVAVTDCWGFVCVAFSATRDGRPCECCSVLTLDGRPVSSTRGFFHLSLWCAVASFDGFDYVVGTDNRGFVHFFECADCTRIMPLTNLSGPLACLEFDRKDRAVVCVTNHGAVTRIPVEALTAK